MALPSDCLSRSCQVAACQVEPGVCQHLHVTCVIVMSRDLPIDFSPASESGVSPSKGMSPARTSRPLSVVPPTTDAVRLTRGQVATRLGISVSTVRRLEGTKLHPTIDSDDVRWFDENEVASLAAEIANTTNPKRRGGSLAATTTTAAPGRSHGEIAALAFERFEQRQSLAEIVVGLRVAPETVRFLFEQWNLGLTEGLQRTQREPTGPRVGDVERVKPDRLAALLAALPDAELTRISVARQRLPFYDREHEFISVSELGGFHVSGPCTTNEILRRFGPGSYRVSAFGIEPSGIRWEVLVEGLRDG